MRRSMSAKRGSLRIGSHTGSSLKKAPIAPVVHDLNLRVLSPKVRGWVQPQSWWGDFRSVWMKG